LRYVAINELDHFEYHDAHLKAMEWRGKNFLWLMSEINATTENSQNSFTKDMCVEDAGIVFENAIIEDIVFNEYKTYGAGGVLIKSVGAEIAIPAEYDEIIESTLAANCFIMGMKGYEIAEDGRYVARFDIDGSFDGGMGYVMTISFSSSTVSWNKFSGEAWYEHPKWKKREHLK